MKQLEGFIVLRKEHYVFRLRKGLYGLKQAPRAWYFKLDESLSSLCFKRSKHGHVVLLQESQ